MDPRVQIGEVTLEIHGVGVPRHAVGTGRCIAFEREERLPEQVDCYVVGERGVPLLLPQPCGLPYAIERL